MSMSLVESFRALFKSLDFGKAWMTKEQASVIYTFAGPIPGPEPIAKMEYSSIEPASAELVEKVFRELDHPNPDFLD
jgi:hypothetical protein